VWCGELELAGDPHIVAILPPTDVYRSVRVLVRLHGEPLGYLSEPTAPDEVDVVGLALRARTDFAQRIEDHLAAELGEAATAVATGTGHLPAPGDGCPNRVPGDELVSVVVCTRNRSDILAACLDRLAALTYPALEIVVVDNAPSDTSTRTLVERRAAEDSRFRYVLEQRPGLSAARNRGIAEARGAYLAYTDDDVAVDPLWVDGLMRGFLSAPDVGCVTGLVCTAAITTAAEAYFDARTSSWSSRVQPERFDMTDHRRDSSLYPFSAGIYGTGANVGFRRDVLTIVGPFDEALGAGTPTRGGEDLDMFVRILLAGRAIVYQPAAVVWHHHRADETALLGQMFGYGTGFTAYLTKCLLARETRSQVLRRIPQGVARLAQIRRDTRERMTSDVGAPRGALTRELAGLAAGPWIYLRSRVRGSRP
jgi:GT2 family glycosyltransferase